MQAHYDITTVPIRDGAKSIITLPNGEHIPFPDLPTQRPPPWVDDSNLADIMQTKLPVNNLVKVQKWASDNADKTGGTYEYWLQIAIVGAAEAARLPVMDFLKQLDDSSVQRFLC